MAIPKKDDTAPITSVQEAERCLNLILLGQDSPLTYKECWDILEQADTTAMETVNGQYLKFEVGKSYNLCFYGIETRQIKGKTIEVAILKDKNEDSLICGSAVLVSACKTLDIPTYIRVIVKGMKTASQSGEYFDLEVKTFPKS